MQLPSLSMEYKTHSLCYKKRLPSVDAIESEKKRKIRTRKREPKQATKILHACEVDKGIIESVIEGKKTVLKLSDFNLVHLKLFFKASITWYTVLIEK